MMDPSWIPAMRMALREARTACSNRNELQSVRAWKLFLLLPHVVVEGSRGGLVPKGNLEERFAASVKGEWASQKKMSKTTHT